MKDGIIYYLDDKPQAYNAYMLDEEHPGDDDPREAYESCKKSKVSSGKKLPLYVIKYFSKDACYKSHLHQLPDVFHTFFV